MPEYTLEPAFALDGYDRSFDGANLREITDIAIVSIAIPLEGKSLTENAIKEAFGTELPLVGKSLTSNDIKTRLVGLGQDLIFAMFAHSKPDAEKVVSRKLKSSAYTTDQTDGWVAIEISGTKARIALERICPIDLHPEQFAVNDSARTSMEHLGTLIIRTDDEAYLILSARSSANSFLHAVETSIRNVM